MSRNPLNARDRAEQIIRGIGPDAQDHDAVAADAARVADEIGAGPGDALRAAAHAWTPHQAPAPTIDYAVTRGLRSQSNSVDAHQRRCPCRAAPRLVQDAAPSR